jgi:SAM-dependent methyltransferase
VPGDDYRKASHRIWEEMAAGWEGDRRSVWDDSRRVGEWLVDALDPQPGETVLELAAGVGDTGFAATRQLGANGRLISTDFSQPMVDAARRRADELGVSNAEFRTLDAERMDVAVAEWPSRSGAIRSKTRGRRFRRRCCANGRGQRRPIRTHPGSSRWRNEARTRDLLEGAGLRPSRIETVEMGRFDSLDAYWHYVTDLAGAVAMLVRALPEEDQRAVRDEVERRVQAYADGDGYRLPGMCLNVLAAWAGRWSPPPGCASGSTTPEFAWSTAATSSASPAPVRSSGAPGTSRGRRSWTSTASWRRSRASEDGTPCRTR